jgi:hypothetical protein
MALTISFWRKLLMRENLFCFLFLNLLLCLTPPAFSCEQTESMFIPCNKTYVNPEQIEFLDNQIFIQIDDVIFRTSGIRSDAAGFYFEDAERECGYLQRPCPRSYCNACNFIWDSVCYLCGKKLK